MYPEPRIDLQCVDKHSFDDERIKLILDDIEDQHWLVSENYPDNKFIEVPSDVHELLTETLYCKRIYWRDREVVA